MFFIVAVYDTEYCIMDIDVMTISFVDYSHIHKYARQGRVLFKGISGINRAVDITKKYGLIIRDADIILPKGMIRVEAECNEERTVVWAMLTGIMKNKTLSYNDEKRNFSVSCDVQENNVDCEILIGGSLWKLKRIDNEVFFNNRLMYITTIGRLCGIGYVRALCCVMMITNRYRFCFYHDKISMYDNESREVQVITKKFLARYAEAYDMRR